MFCCLFHTLYFFLFTYKKLKATDNKDKAQKGNAAFCTRLGGIDVSHESRTAPMSATRRCRRPRPHLFCLLNSQLIKQFSKCFSTIYVALQIGKLYVYNAYRHKYSVLLYNNYLNTRTMSAFPSSVKALTAESFLEFLSDSSTRTDVNHNIAGTVGVS